MGAQFAGQGVNLALGIVTTVVIVRALEATRYGEWATLMATIELVSLFGNLGLETVAIRFAAQDPEREGRWVGAATSLQLLIAVPLLVVFLGTLLVIASDSEMLIAGIVLSLLYLTSALSLLRIVFRLHVRNHIVVAFTTINSILWAGSVIAIAASGGGLVAYALAFAAIAIAVQVCTAIVATRTIKVHWRGSRDLWRSLAGVGISVGIASTLTISYGRIDQILVYELAPNAADVGIYAAMYKILDNAGFVPLAVMTTLFPIMAGLYPADPARLRRMMQLAIDYLAMIALGALALTIAASGPIVELLFGSEYAEGATVLPILFAAFLPICIGTVAGNMVVATNLQRRYIWYAAMGLLLNVILNILLIPRYGIEAAAATTVLTEILVVSLSLAAVLGRIELRLSMRRMLLAVVAAAAAGVGIWGLRLSGAGAIILVAAMAALYPSLLIVTRALDVTELRRLARNRDAEESA